MGKKVKKKKAPANRPKKRASAPTRWASAKIGTTQFISRVLEHFANLGDLWHDSVEAFKSGALREQATLYLKVWFYHRDFLVQRTFIALAALVLMFTSVLLLLPSSSQPNPETLSPSLSKQALIQAARVRPWSFFYPVWEGGNLVSGESLPHHPFSEREGVFQYWIQDPEHRISSEFTVPAELRDRVLFWTMIYSTVPSSILVLHDERDPGIVYGYLNLDPLTRGLGSGTQFKLEAEDLEKKVKRILRNKMWLAVDVKKDFNKNEELSSLEKVNLRAFLSKNGSLSPAGVKALSRGMRGTSGRKSAFERAMDRSEKLLPHIEAVFKQRDLPTELARIPFVESSFFSKAHSRSGAMGVWQFMPRTARALIHSTDRNKWWDPVWQTRGAATLLSRYRRALPDWGITLTAYNYGIGNMKRIMSRNQITSIEQLVSLPENRGLGFDGRNYYAQFLAAMTIEKYRDYFMPHHDSVDFTKDMNGHLAPEICNQD